MKKEDSGYFDKYSNLQHIKHRVIREYLQGWFPKVGFWAGKLLYLDSHAGKGKHLTGEEGSPLIALRSLLEHRAKEQILKKSQVSFVFVERNEKNCKSLSEELKALEYPPDRISINIINYDSFEFLNGLCTKLKKEHSQMVPSFMFIDPYGFKIPCELLRQIMKYPRSELLVTVMWRELDMAIRNTSRSEGLINTLNEVFGCETWKEITSIQKSDSRAEEAVRLLRKQIGAKWSTYIKMLDNGRTRYLLLHLTNHDDGRDLIKNVLWNCCPEGGWFARKSDDPKQYFLIKPVPDLEPLETWLINKLSCRCFIWDELEEMLRETVWLNKHLWEVIRKFRNEGRITATDFKGRFSQKANPTLSLMGS